MLPRRLVCLGLAVSFAALAVLHALPPRASAQDARLPATGDLLLRALPPQVDLMVHTSDLPALLASASAAGFGPKAAWKQAFRDQTAAWCEEAESGGSLAKAAEGLLSAADGEVVAASLPLPLAGRDARYTLLALRSSKGAEELAKHVDGVIEFGLRSRYPGDLTEERIGDRPVRSLAGIHRRLYVLVEDGLVVISDHALPLGLFLRGLERAASDGVKASGGVARFDVRYGPGRSRWSGWMFGKGESASWNSEAAANLSGPMLLLDAKADGVRAVSAVASKTLSDLPLLPVPPPAWLATARSVVDPSADRSALLLIRTDGRLAIGGTGAFPAEAARAVGEAGGFVNDAGGLFVVNGADSTMHTSRTTPGYAARHGWLRGFASGGLPLPLPGMDRGHLAPVWKAVQAGDPGAATGVDEILPWKTGERAGELRGPAWHGPATMLMLRTLHHLARGMKPGATVDPSAVPRAPKPPTGAPLPAPGADDTSDE